MAVVMKRFLRSVVMVLMGATVGAVVGTISIFGRVVGGALHWVVVAAEGWIIIFGLFGLFVSLPYGVALIFHGENVEGWGDVWWGLRHIAYAWAALLVYGICSDGAEQLAARINAWWKSTAPTWWV